MVTPAKPLYLPLTGIVPGITLIVFLGALALYTAILLINFKVNHPEVHTMGLFLLLNKFKKLMGLG
jgi:hypothetical protein